MMIKYSKYILILVFSTIFLSCDSIITILDEYNSPYEIVAIPGDDSISVRFISGITASDFAGFNFYVNDTGAPFTLFTDAIPNSSPGLPTVASEAHVRQFFTIDVPNGPYVNGTKYYVTVTAYGTNTLADDGRIETPISTIAEVVPRATTVANNITSVSTSAGTLNFDVARLAVTSTSAIIRDMGVQTNFNSIVILTNSSDTSSFSDFAVLGDGKLYMLFNGSAYSKVWITGISGTTVSVEYANQTDITWNGV